jgi:phytochrome-interacting factor 4
MSSPCDLICSHLLLLHEFFRRILQTDKASMLDEAIEYLKSLQLQLQVSSLPSSRQNQGTRHRPTCDVCIVTVQMMWMGGGMAAAAAPVVFPAGVHQYMQRMVAGPPPHHVASMPGMPFMAPPAAVHGPPPPVPDLYTRYLAVDHHHHLPPPPPMVAPPPYTVQQHCLQGTMGFYQRQNPALPPPPTAVPAGSPSDGILHKKYGTPQNVNVNVMAKICRRRVFMLDNCFLLTLNHMHCIHPCQTQKLASHISLGDPFG